MELPDFMSYANKFSANDFMEKVSSIAKRAGSKLVYAALILYYTLQSDNVSKADKAIIIGMHLFIRTRVFSDRMVRHIRQLHAPCSRQFA